MPKQIQRHNGKEYVYEREPHKFTIKDAERIFGIVIKRHKNNDADVGLIVNILFSLLFEIAPYFRNWLCLWLKLQEAISFIVTTLGILKIIQKLVYWAQRLEAALAVGYLQKFWKRYAIVTAFCTAVVLTLGVIYDIVNFLSGGNTFSSSVRDVLDKAICQGEDSGIIDDIVKGATQALTQTMIDTIMEAEQEGEIIDLFPES